VNSMFACGKDDDYATTFTAKSPVGKSIDGVVCCEFIGKACTVRF